LPAKVNSAHPQRTTRRLLTYNYGARNFQVVINGYTGAIAGKYPKSWIKITLGGAGCIGGGRLLPATGKSVR